MTSYIQTRRIDEAKYVFQKAGKTLKNEGQLRALEIILTGLGAENL